MKLFINSGVCARKWNRKVQIEELENSKLKLAIPNYLEEKREEEFFTFKLPGIDEESLEEDCLFKNISLKKTDKNTYQVNFQDEAVDNETEKTSDLSMYVLVRNASAVKDDIFIPVSMKDKVKVLERIRFVDFEVDYGTFLSNVYLIEITLKEGECLPVYLTYENPGILNKHYVFSKTDCTDEVYSVSKKSKPTIILKWYNKKDYVSLSTLCEEKTD